MKIDLPDDYNSKEVLAMLAEKYPDTAFKIKPTTHRIIGSGDKVETEQGHIELEIQVASSSEIARIEQEVKQAIFDLPMEKTDHQEKEEENLKDLLSGPAFVYILSKIDDLEREIKKLSNKETTKGNGNDKSETSKF